MSDSENQSSSSAAFNNISQDLNNAFLLSPSQLQSTPSMKMHKNKLQKNKKKNIKWQIQSDSESQLSQVKLKIHDKQHYSAKTPSKQNKSTQSLRKQRTADIKTKSGNKYQNVCSICLSQFKDQRGSLQCKHEFCFQCIQQWCQTSSICPCCRIQVDYIHKITKNKQTNCITQIQKINVQKKKLTVQSQYDHYTCYQCGLGDDQNVLLICDQCDFYCCHVYCDPQLGFRVPQGDWYCIYCASARRNRHNIHQIPNRRNNRSQRQNIQYLNEQSFTQQSNKSITGVAMRTRSRQIQPVNNNRGRHNVRVFRNIRRRR